MLASDAITHITHTLGATIDSALTALDLVNLAGRELCDLHSWRWLERRTATLGYTADQNYVELPDDFASIHFLVHTAEPNQPVYPTGLDEVLMARLTAVSGNPFRYAVAHRIVSDQSLPVIELDRAPSTTDADALTVIYRGTWTDVASTGDTLPLPVRPDSTGGFCDLLMYQICRALARGWEEEGDGSFDMRLAQIKAGPVFRAATQRDGLVMGSRGRMRGGALAAARNYTPVSSITDFSGYSGPT